jgi:MFS family permease
MSAADLSRNPRRFVLFTVFYNARAYYPVLAILFLDLGLTLDQFVLLNMIWAGTIFLFEVPSGALADIIGRRKLLIISTLLMVLEITCLLFAPKNGGVFLFAICVANRVFSGMSEAFASGADEALAYDSLPEAERERGWDKTLASAMRWRSVGYVVAMILGSVLYDPSILNHYLPFQISSNIAHRLPVAVVLIQAVVCLIITMTMVEPPSAREDHPSGSCLGAVQLTLRTARWVFTTPHTLIIVVVGLSIDSIARNFATLNSSYYRLIDLPEWSYGFIGASIGLMGWFVPAVAKKLNERFSTLTNLGIAAAVTLACLATISQATPYYGLVPAMVLMTTLGYLGFTISRSLHRETDSSRRATVLSVKGLAFNLGYGLFSFGFSRLLTGFQDLHPGNALRQALVWQVPIFMLMTLLLFTWAHWLWKRNSPAR